MKVSHIKIRVIAYDWDDPQKLKEVILSFLKGLPEEELKKIKIKETKGTGLVSTYLTVYELNLTNRKQILTFFKNLLEKLTNLEDLYRNINFDERFSIYIRLDKDLLVEKGIAKPLYGRDVFHIKISFDMPHKTKEKVINELKNIIDFIKK